MKRKLSTLGQSYWHTIEQNRLYQDHYDAWMAYLDEPGLIELDGVKDFLATKPFYVKFHNPRKNLRVQPFLNALMDKTNDGHGLSLKILTQLVNHHLNVLKSCLKHLAVYLSPLPDVVFDVIFPNLPNKYHYFNKFFVDQSTDANHIFIAQGTRVLNDAIMNRDQVLDTFVLFMFMRQGVSLTKQSFEAIVELDTHLHFDDYFVQWVYEYYESGMIHPELAQVLDPSMKMNHLHTFLKELCSNENLILYLKLNR